MLFKIFVQLNLSVFGLHDWFTWPHYGQEALPALLVSIILIKPERCLEVIEE